MEKIDCEYLSCKSVEICYLGKPLISTEAIQGFNGVDGVMYVAKLKYTKDKEVVRTLQIIKDAGVNAVGFQAISFLQYIIWLHY